MNHKHEGQRAEGDLNVILCLYECTGISLHTHPVKHTEYNTQKYYFCSYSNSWQDRFLGKYKYLRDTSKERGSHFWPKFPTKDIYHLVSEP